MHHPHDHQPVCPPLTGWQPWVCSKKPPALFCLLLVRKVRTLGVVGRLERRILLAGHLALVVGPSRYYPLAAIPAAPIYLSLPLFTCFSPIQTICSRKGRRLRFEFYREVSLLRHRRQHIPAARTRQISEEHAQAFGRSGKKAGSGSLVCRPSTALVSPNEGSP